MIQYATEQSRPRPCIIAWGRRFRRSPTMRTTFEFASQDGNSVQALLRRALTNAFRLAFFQESAPDHFSVTWLQVAAFSAATLLIPILYDIASVGIDGRFDWDAIPSAIAHLPIILLAAIVTAYALGRSENTLFLFQAFLMIAAVIDSVVYFTYGAALALHPQPWPYQVNIGYHVVPPIWFALACARAAAGPLAGDLGRRTLAYAVCLLLLVLPLTHMNRGHSLWQAEATKAIRNLRNPANRFWMKTSFTASLSFLNENLPPCVPGAKA